VAHAFTPVNCLLFSPCCEMFGLCSPCFLYLLPWHKYYWHGIRLL